MTRVMGILNVTPDSFSDGGTFANADEAIQYGKKLIAQGAHIIDIGGQSTRPGADPVTVNTELDRVIPVIQGLANSGATISIDTIHAETAAAAVAAGARIINDVSGGLNDPAMYDTAAKASTQHSTKLIIGHWRGIPDPNHTKSHYENVVQEVTNTLDTLAHTALTAGIDPKHIILDPGLGFDKTSEQSWQLLTQLPTLTKLGYPVLIGASRKRMIADTITHPPTTPPQNAHPRNLDLASAIVSTLAAQTGAWGVRVHDVASTVQALTIYNTWSLHQTPPPPTHNKPQPLTVAPPPPRPATHTPHPTSTPPHQEHAPDRITLTGLTVFAHHGVYDIERATGQKFLVDVELSLQLQEAAQSDDLNRTVHYGELAEAIIAACERNPVDLIETVAERVAQVALSFPGVHSVRATVHKPNAPIPATFTDVSVSVLRHAEPHPQPPHPATTPLPTGDTP